MHRRRAGSGRALRGRPLIDAPGSRLGELRILLRLATPIAVAQVGLMAMALVDTAVLGRVSVDDLAGAGIGRSIGFASTILALGVSLALEPIAAQAIGAGDHGRAWRGFVTSLKGSLLLWAPLMAAAFAITLTLPPLGVSAAVVLRVRLYLLGQGPGLAANLAFMAGRVFLQAHGRTAPALVGSLVANGINFVVSNVLVRGDEALRAVGLRPRGLPALGALGGGIAFTFASFVLTAIVLAATLRHRHREPGEPVQMRAVMRLGMPIGAQMLAEVGIFSLVALISGALGAEVASAHQIAIGMASFTFMGAVGVAGATSVRVGHAIGAGRSPRQPGWLGIALGAAGMMVAALVFAAFPRALVTVFTHDERVIPIGVDLVRIAAAFQLFDGVQTVAAGALRGAGDVRFPFVANVIAHWFVGFPVALLLGFALHGGAQGLWWGLTAGLVAISAALTARFAVISRRQIARV